MLFDVYGPNAGFQWLGLAMVLIALILLNEFARRTDLYGQAVDGHGAADAEEHEDAAGLGAAGELVQQNERDEHHRQAEPLEAGVRAVHVE